MHFTAVFLSVIVFSVDFVGGRSFENEKSIEKQKRWLAKVQIDHVNSLGHPQKLQFAFDSDKIMQQSPLPEEPNAEEDGGEAEAEEPPPPPPHLQVLFAGNDHVLHSLGKQPVALHPAAALLPPNAEAVFANRNGVIYYAQPVALPGVSPQPIPKPTPDPEPQEVNAEGNEPMGEPSDNNPPVPENANDDEKTF